MAIEYLKRGISDQKRLEDDANTAKIVSQTLLDIEERGDRAVRELAVKFDLPLQIFRLSGIYSNQFNILKRLRLGEVKIINKKNTHHLTTFG